MQRHTQTAEDTENLAAALARVRPAGESAPPGAPTVLYLEGDLGTGKTTFARGFLRGCGIEGRVASPTYTLLELYAAGALTFLHVDLYRLKSPAELAQLGLREYARPGFLWLIEWPERGSGGLPPPDVRVRFAAGEAWHGIDISASSALGHAWLERLESP